MSTYHILYNRLSRSNTGELEAHMLDEIMSGETLEYHNIDPYEETFTPVVGDEWQEAKWANGESNGELYLSDEWINKVYYQGDPDKRQLLPIMSILVAGSQNTLVNDYGY